ncbi:TadE/TadG family type IV pilus assembly protein [Sulfobacillus harzensis]|uniref:TadE/TadG family type IV pilus assembly protein n=1 Tax=Sulfobacillus harzensis TaxID=2729629 RepID=UPI0030840898
MELLLVLPVLTAVFLGMVTVASLFLGNVAVSQAAEQGVRAWAGGASTASVTETVAAALRQEGISATPVTQFANQGSAKSVTVTVPFKLLNTGTIGSVSASRTITSAASAPVGSGPSGPVGGGGGGQGGGGVVYHHFPRW